MLVARRTDGCASADAPSARARQASHAGKRRARRDGRKILFCGFRSFGDAARPMRTMLAFATIARACETCEQGGEKQAKPRSDLRAHYQSSVGVPALPQ